MQELVGHQLVRTQESHFICEELFLELSLGHFIPCKMKSEFCLHVHYLSWALEGVSWGFKPTINIRKQGGANFLPASSISRPGHGLTLCEGFSWSRNNVTGLRWTISLGYDLPALKKCLWLCKFFTNEKLTLELIIGDNCSVSLFCKQDQLPRIDIGDEWIYL